MMEKYLDYSTGRVLFISPGLSQDIWATYWRKPSGALKRVISPALPLRRDRDQAQRDLDAYAAAKGWRKIEA